MAAINNVPEFGLLAGCTVISHGEGISMPFGASLMAEHGATVVHIEDTEAPDILRAYDRNGYYWSQERRNMLDLALDVTTPEGREVLLKLVEKADILMESLGGGAYADLGLTDEVLWEANPKLVILHESGYGQTGDPGYVKRPANDSVIQAFGGMAVQNGLEPPNPPLDARPYMIDYQTAMFSMGAALVGYVEALNTGKGESIDLAAFEIAWKTQYSFPIEWIMDGMKLYRTGNTESMVGLSNYRCKDDEYVMLCLGGATPLRKTLEVVGLGDDPDYPPNTQYTFHGTPQGDKFYEHLRDWCLDHTAAEVEAIFGEKGIPASMTYDTPRAAENPHVKAREVFTEWDDPALGKVRGINVYPKVTKSPACIWRGAPTYGMDNADILAELGYGEAEIAALYEKGVLACDGKQS